MEETLGINQQNRRGIDKMKWAAKDTEANLDSWSEWFAWYPVKIGSSWIWLEMVVRQMQRPYYYRLIDKIFFMPSYNYKESILDVIKDRND